MYHPEENMNWLNHWDSLQSESEHRDRCPPGQKEIPVDLFSPGYQGDELLESLRKRRKMCAPQ